MLRLIKGASDLDETDTALMRRTTELRAGITTRSRLPTVAMDATEDGEDSVDVKVAKEGHSS